MAPKVETSKIQGKSQIFRKQLDEGFSSKLKFTVYVFYYKANLDSRYIILQ